MWSASGVGVREGSDIAAAAMPRAGTLRWSATTFRDAGRRLGAALSLAGVFPDPLGRADVSCPAVIGSTDVRWIGRRTATMGSATALVGLAAGFSRGSGEIAAGRPSGASALLDVLSCTGSGGSPTGLGLGLGGCGARCTGVAVLFSLVLPIGRTAAGVFRNGDPSPDRAREGFAGLLEDVDGGTALRGIPRKGAPSPDRPRELRPAPLAEPAPSEITGMTGDADVGVDADLCTGAGVGGVAACDVAAPGPVPGAKVCAGAGADTEEVGDAGACAGADGEVDAVADLGGDAEVDVRPGGGTAASGTPGRVADLCAGAGADPDVDLGVGVEVEARAEPDAGADSSRDSGAGEFGATGLCASADDVVGAEEEADAGMGPDVGTDGSGTTGRVADLCTGAGAVSDVCVDTVSGLGPGAEADAEGNGAADPCTGADSGVGVGRGADEFADEGGITGLGVERRRGTGAGTEPDAGPDASEDGDNAADLCTDADSPADVTLRTGGMGTRADDAGAGPSDDADVGPGTGSESPVDVLLGAGGRGACADGAGAAPEDDADVGLGASAGGMGATDGVDFAARAGMDESGSTGRDADLCTAAGEGGAGASGVALDGADLSPGAGTGGSGTMGSDAVLCTDAGAAPDVAVDEVTDVEVMGAGPDESALGGGSTGRGAELVPGVEAGPEADAEVGAGFGVDAGGGGVAGPDVDLCTGAGAPPGAGAEVDGDADVRTGLDVDEGVGVFGAAGEPVRGVLAGLPPEGAPAEGGDGMALCTGAGAGPDAGIEGSRLAGGFGRGVAAAFPLDGACPEGADEGCVAFCVVDAGALGSGVVRVGPAGPSGVGVPLDGVGAGGMALLGASRMGAPRPVRCGLVLLARSGVGGAGMGGVAEAAVRCTGSAGAGAGAGAGPGAGVLGGGDGRPGSAWSDAGSGALAAPLRPGALVAATGRTRRAGSGVTRAAVRGDRPVEARCTGRAVTTGSVGGAPVPEAPAARPPSVAGTAEDGADLCTGAGGDGMVVGSGWSAGRKVGRTTGRAGPPEPSAWGVPAGRSMSWARPDGGLGRTT